jgi:transposase
VPNRAALTGIVFVLKTAIPWEMLPEEMGCGSGSTRWRRLRDWQAGGGGRVATAAPGLAGQAGRSGRDRLVEGVPGFGECPGQKGGEKVGKNPPDRGKPGSKRRLVSDRGGVPLAVVLTAANVHDSKVPEEVVDEIEPIRRPAGKPGRPRRRPQKLHADKGYDFPRCPKALRERGIEARIAKRGKDKSEGLGRHHGGWSSGRWGGWPATAGFRCATRGGPTSMRRSSTSVAHSYLPQLPLMRFCNAP